MKISIERGDKVYTQEGKRRCFYRLSRIKVMLYFKYSACEISFNGIKMIKYSIIKDNGGVIRLGKDIYFLLKFGGNECLFRSKHYFNNHVLHIFQDLVDSDNRIYWAYEDIERFLSIEGKLIFGDFPGVQSKNIDIVRINDLFTNVTIEIANNIIISIYSSNKMSATEYSNIIEKIAYSISPKKDPRFLTGWIIDRNIQENFFNIKIVAICTDAPDANDPV